LLASLHNTRKLLVYNLIFQTVFVILIFLMVYALIYLLIVDTVKVYIVYTLWLV